MRAGGCGCGEGCVERAARRERAVRRVRERAARGEWAARRGRGEGAYRSRWTVREVWGAPVLYPCGQAAYVNSRPRTVLPRAAGREVKRAMGICQQGRADGGGRGEARGRGRRVY